MVVWRASKENHVVVWRATYVNALAHRLTPFDFARRTIFRRTVHAYTQPRGPSSGTLSASTSR